MDTSNEPKPVSCTLSPAERAAEMTSSIAFVTCSAEVLEIFDRDAINRIRPDLFMVNHHYNIYWPFYIEPPTLIDHIPRPLRNPAKSVYLGLSGISSS